MVNLALVKQPNVDQDAVEIGELYHKATASIIDSVRYELECGLRLTAKKQEVGHGNWLHWLEVNADVLGFENRFTAAHLMAAARKHKCAVNGTFGITEATQINREIWGNLAPVHGTQGTGDDDEWFTPEERIEPVRAVLDEIDLDPATHFEAQKLIKATNYYTKADDGLAHEWHGRVWLNPPYSRNLISKFVAKLCNEYSAGRVSAAIMLTHNYTDTAWFQEALQYAGAVCFTKGRIEFVRLNGEHGTPLQGHAYHYFGGDLKRFVRCFSPIGLVVAPLFRGRVEQ